MYEIGRYLAIKGLTDRELRELQGKEKKRGFIWPAFMIASYFSMNGKVFANYSEKNQEAIREMFNNSRPSLADLPAGTVAMTCDLNYMHAWDFCLWNNQVLREFVRKNARNGKNLIEELEEKESEKQFEMNTAGGRGALD